MEIHFNTPDLLLLCSSLVIFLISILFFQTGRVRTSLVFLFSGSLLLGFFMAGLDPFLNLWDEQYHALVAKHMVSDPFKPTLYANPLVDVDYRDWGRNHIWLHKQPLFLWQIAGSLALFGESAMAVRIPSVIIHSIASLFIFRIGHLAHNSRTGFYGALFFAVGYYPLELIAGKFPTEHNDISFLFYVLGSFWAWFEYQKSNKPTWLLLIGLFAGCAVLVKWLVGLLVYACWGLMLLFQKSDWPDKFRSFLPLIKSAVVALFVFIPWQIYILIAFPTEAAYEYALNTAHFLVPVEAHGGDTWFHIRAIKTLYGSGDAVPFILLAGLIVFIRKMKDRMYRIFTISAIVITYVFFTLAATKMISFTLIAAPFVFLGLGALVDAFLHSLPENSKRIAQILRPVLLLTICFFLMNPAKIQEAHTFTGPDKNYNRSRDLAQMEFIRHIRETLGNEGLVIFNADCRAEGHITVMFYTDHIAYDFIPDEVLIDRLKKEGHALVIADNDSLPDFILRDGEIVKIKMPSGHHP